MVEESATGSRSTVVNNGPINLQNYVYVVSQITSLRVYVFLQSGDSRCEESPTCQKLELFLSTNLKHASKVKESDAASEDRDVVEPSEKVTARQNA